MVRGPLNDEARALARAAVARALARGEAEALPAEAAVSDWRGLFALALRALRVAARTQRLQLEHLACYPDTTELQESQSVRY